MKLMIITTFLGIGGVESVIYQQCKVLKKHNVDVEVICLKQNGMTGKLLEQEFVRIYDLSALGLRESHKILIRYIRNTKPNIIVLHNADIHRVISRTKKEVGYKLVYQIHNDLWNDSELIESYEDMLDVVISSHPKMFFKAQSINANHFMLINPIDERFFDPSKHETNNVVLGYCGRIAPEKSLVSLANIAQEVKKKLKNVSVLIVGDAVSDRKFQAYKQTVVDEFARLKVPLRITGFTTDCYDLFKEMSVAVCASAYEGFCNFSWEAAAHGVPLVSTDVGANYLLLDDVVPVVVHPSGRELEDHLNGQFANLIVDRLNHSKNITDKAYLAHPNIYENNLTSLIFSL